MSTINKSRVVAFRLSIHFQNILSPTKNPQRHLDAINHHLAVFREMLMILGQGRDCPELRLKIRKWRCILVQQCEITVHFLLSLKNSCSTDKIVNVNHYLILLFHLMHLCLREFNKCYHLMQIIPMDMEEYLENRACSSNLGNVRAISEILLLKKQTKPDFVLEELLSIALDEKQISQMMKDIQEFVPQENDSNFEIHTAVTSIWPEKTKRKLFCCGRLSQY